MAPALTTPHMFVVGRDGKLACHGAIDDDRRQAVESTVNHVDRALAELTAGPPSPARRRA
ncbi:MAG: hypothetical protein ACYDIE_01740 [Candidatus Krumholzibacteriia bacterium]